MTYNEEIYFGHLIRGDLRGALAYIDRFLECAELRNSYAALFANEYGSPAPDVNQELDRILGLYRRYYRDVFYLDIGKDSAAVRLRAGLSRYLKIDSFDLDELEQGPVAEAFESAGFRFLGGRTDGFYGPYVWKNTENAAYDVALPGGVQRYTVKLLDGFITKSWLDYLSFGRLGTGGWTEADGCICCVKAAYDLDGEDFKVSLIKHEAQHVWDFRKYGDLSSAELEYRAKLVELIYSSRRNLLPRFALEAGSENADGHAGAARRILDGFERKLNVGVRELDGLPVTVIQRTAQELFSESRP